MTAQLKDVVSGGVAEDGRKLWLRLRFGDRDRKTSLTPGLKAQIPLVASKLIRGGAVATWDDAPEASRPLPGRRRERTWIWRPL